MFKNVISLTFLIVGTTIGAGFASGKEIAVFFAGQGFWGIAFAVLAGVLTFFVNYMFLLFGKKYEPKSIAEINSVLFSKNAKFANFSFIISCLISVAGMVSGTTVAGMELSNNTILLTMIMIIIASVVVAKGVKGLEFINNLLMPVLILAIVFLCTKSIGNNLGGEVYKGNLNVFYGVISSVVYVGMNMLLSGVVLMQIAKNYSKKEIVLSSVLVSVVLTVIIILSIAAFVSVGEGAVLSDMPFLHLSHNIGINFSKAFAIIMLIGIFTTLISAMYVAVCYFKNFIKNTAACIVLVLFLGSVIAVVGFSNVVKFFYPLTGVMGAVFSFKVMFNFGKFALVARKNINLKNKKAVNK